MTAIVFVGPTLPAKAVTELLEAEVLPPVKQGDVYRAARDKPTAIGIIDGYFEGVPSVWHKEILWAIEQGIPVFGSASMGALRAAELADFGMIGVGRIFEGYHSGALRDDDEVAVVHSPAELGFQPLSEPMVSVRATVASACEESLLSADRAEAIVSVAKSVHYRDRTWPRVMAEVGTGDDLAQFGRWLPQGRVDAKRDDAREMLQQMADFLRNGAARSSDPIRVERTLMWQGLTRRLDTETVQHRTSARDLLDELRLDPDLYAKLRDSAALDYLAVEEAARRGLAADREMLLDGMARHRDDAGLPRRQDLIGWLAENDLDEAGYEAFLTNAVLTEWVKALRADRLEPHILSALRWSGNYADVKARAEAKQAVLASTGEQRNVGLDRLRLMLWYFERILGLQVPDDLDSYAQTLGFSDREEFCKLIEREFLYCQESGSQPVAGTREE